MAVWLFEKTRQLAVVHESWSNVKKVKGKGEERPVTNCGGQGELEILMEDGVVPRSAPWSARNYKAPQKKDAREWERIKPRDPEFWQQAGDRCVPTHPNLEGCHGEFRVTHKW